MKEIGLAPTDLRGLRAVPVETILDAQGRAILQLASQVRGIPFQPTLDGRTPARAASGRHLRRAWPRRSRDGRDQRRRVACSSASETRSSGNSTPLPSSAASSATSRAATRAAAPTLRGRSRPIAKRGVPRASPPSRPTCGSRSREIASSASRPCASPSARPQRAARAPTGTSSTGGLPPSAARSARATASRSPSSSAPSGSLPGIRKFVGEGPAADAPLLGHAGCVGFLRPLGQPLPRGDR